MPSLIFFCTDPMFPQWAAHAATGISGMFKDSVGFPEGWQVVDVMDGWKFEKH